MLFGNSPSDFGMLPPQFTGDVQMFLPNGTVASATANWHQWVKPRGTSMVYMICIGGGGGGGGGRTGATNTTRGGGGGGGSAAFTSVIIPAVLLPDVLKISVGVGGQGGAANTNGLIGDFSYISTGTGLTAGTAIPNLILRAAGGGFASAGGAATAGGAGGAGASTTIAQLGPLGKLGFFTNNGTATSAGYAGIQGSNGGSQNGAIGTGITTTWNVSPLSGGTGGAGINTPAQAGFAGGLLSLQSAVDFADGTFTPAASFRVGGPAGTAIIAGGNGSPGVKSFKPFLNTGGTGGGSSDGAAGGNGGDGGYGCGGGGGGGGTTGGSGGNGGPGLVVIISW